jgi:hypothetical protein
VEAVNPIYAMQRANGDWFALEGHGGLRVPVFSSHDEAMQARSFNVEMLLFRPVRVDEKALKELVAAEGEPAAHFWLVKQGSTNMKRGVPLKFGEFAGVIRGTNNGSVGGSLKP